LKQKVTMEKPRTETPDVETAIGTESTRSSVEEIVRDANMSTARLLPLDTCDIAVYSQRSRDKLTSNEDSAVIIPLGERGVVLAVADGVGGLPEGARASQLALEILVETVTAAGETGRMRSAILDGIEKANRKILALRAGATTIAVAQIVDNRLRTYHVGDSEVIVVGGRGVLKWQTLAHGPVAYGVHCGLIDPIEAMTHESRNLISNVVGDRDMRIDIGPSRRLAPRDVVLLCSDGITDNLTVAELSQTISGKPIQAAASSILAGLQARREQNGPQGFKEDDATFLIFRRKQVGKALLKDATDQDRNQKPCLDGVEGTPNQHTEADSRATETLETTQ
jgi:PPM family protein phosphatase